MDEPLILPPVLPARLPVWRQTPGQRLLQQAHLDRLTNWPEQSHRLVRLYNRDRHDLQVLHLRFPPAHRPGDLRPPAVQRQPFQQPIPDLRRLFVFHCSPPNGSQLLVRMDSLTIFATNPSPNQSKRCPRKREFNSLCKRISSIWSSSRLVLPRLCTISETISSMLFPAMSITTTWIGINALCHSGVSKTSCFGFFIPQPSNILTL